ncbi:uncharacterized protein LOC144920428 [Branchiostoma floridae x Branchiostoma belcheri]
MAEGRGMDADGYSRPRKWPVAEDAGYMFSYPRRPNDLPDNFHTTHDVKEYVSMVSTGLTQNPEVGARYSSGEKGYVEMKSVEPEYVNVPRGTGKYGREQVYGAASMNYSIPAPRVPTEAQNVTKHHVYVNVPQRSRLTSEGAECSSGVSDVSGCSPEFVLRSPGVRESLRSSPGVSDVSGCSPEFVSRSSGVSDVESSSEFLPQSPGVPLHMTTSQPKMPDDTDGRGTAGFTGKTTEDTVADYRHVDMEPAAGGRCYHVYRTPAFDNLEEQGYRCIVSINETSASRAFGLSGTRELEVDMGTPAIILTPRAGEGSSPPITWPLHYIRRYGTDGDAVFQIEAGRRCYPGPGIFTFTVLSGKSQDILAKVELASDMHLNVSD